jgi:hypothetical protein
VVSVSDVQYKQRAVMEFLVAEEGSVRNIHKRLCNVYGSATVDRSTVGRWAKRATASETGKPERHPGLLQQMKPGSIILNRRQKCNPWNGTILNLQNKKLKNSPSVGKVYLYIL